MSTVINLFKRYLQYRKHLALGIIIANLYIILTFSLNKVRPGGLLCLGAGEDFALKYRSDAYGGKLRVTTLTANCKQCSGSISDSHKRLAASQADCCLSLHSQESVVQSTHALKDLMRCSNHGQ